MFFEIPEGSKLILAGNEKDMENYRKFLDTYFLHYDVTAIADTVAYEKRDYLRGLDIVPYDKWTSKEGILVIFGENWFFAAEELHQQGYVLLRDFVPEWFFEVGYRETCISYMKLLKIVGQENVVHYIRYISYCKKIAVIYGDGSIPNIVRILSRTKEFCEDYVLLSLPPVKVLERENVSISIELWKYIRLLVVQSDNMSEDKEYNAEFVKQQVLQNCKIVDIPKFFFWGYFPQACTNKKNIRVLGEDGIQYAPFTYGDKNLNARIEGNSSLQEMQNVVTNIDFYSKEEVKQFAEESFQYIRKAESNCDIQYAKWLEKSYKKQKLFLNPTMPSYEMLRYVAKEIVKFLGYVNCHINEKGLRWNTIGELPVYKSVEDGLGLCFNVQMVDCCNAYYKEGLTMERYVEEYHKLMNGNN